MKKNYFMVLIALLAFALNANAQDATGQDETNNRMTVKMNDGTSFILNTDNVAEITFGDGEPAFSGQNIIKALEALDELGQYVYRFEALEKNDVTLMDYVTQLQYVEVETIQRDYEIQCEIDVLMRETANLKDCIYDLKDRSSAQEGRTVYLESIISELQAIIDNQQNMINQQKDNITDQQAQIALQQQQIYSLQGYVDALANEVEVLKDKVASMQQ